MQWRWRWSARESRYGAFMHAFHSFGKDEDVAKMGCPVLRGIASLKDSVLDPETEQWNLVMLNAVTAGKLAPMAVWAKPLPAGESELDMGRGAYVVLGFVREDLHMAPHVNEAQNGSGPKNLDWLFE